MSHLLSASKFTIEHLHELARIKTIGFTEVDEQSLIAFLGLALRSLFLSSLSFSLLVTSLCRDRFLNLGCIGIVGKETAEGHRNNLLDDVLLLEIFEVAVDVVHERCYLLFIDVHLFYLIHGSIELLRANLLGCGQRSINKLLANLLLYEAHLILLARVYDRNRGALLAGTTCTARAMGVVLNVVGQSVVDDVREVIDIKSTGSHIRCHKQLHSVLAELLHSEVTLVL